MFLFGGVLSAAVFNQAFKILIMLSILCFYILQCNSIKMASKLPALSHQKGDSSSQQMKPILSKIEGLSMSLHKRNYSHHQRNMTRNALQRLLEKVAVVQQALERLKSQKTGLTRWIHAFKMHLLVYNSLVLDHLQPLWGKSAKKLETKRSFLFEKEWWACKKSSKKMSLKRILFMTWLPFSAILVSRYTALKTSL